MLEKRLRRQSQIVVVEHLVDVRQQFAECRPHDGIQLPAGAHQIGESLGTRRRYRQTLPAVKTNNSWLLHTYTCTYMHPSTARYTLTHMYRYIKGVYVLIYLPLPFPRLAMPLGSLRCRQMALRASAAPTEQRRTTRRRTSPTPAGTGLPCTHTSLLSLHMYAI